MRACVGGVGGAHARLCSMDPGSSCAVCADAACTRVCMGCFRAADKDFKRKRRKPAKKDLKTVVKSATQRLRSLKDSMCSAICHYDKLCKGKTTKEQQEQACVLLMKIERMCNDQAAQTNSEGVDMYLGVSVWTRERESGSHALTGAYSKGDKSPADLIPRVPGCTAI